MSKQTICIDFDGVIHQYTSGWTSPSDIPDEPTVGVREALVHLAKSYEIVVLSTRAQTESGKFAIRTWWKKHDLPEVALITDRKPPALVYLDDRGLRFDGDWAIAIHEIENFRVWNK